MIDVVNNKEGFTLAELLIAMAISLVVMGAIFLTFKSQQDSYVIQTQVSAMQQNLRAAMYILTRDIQMAGYYTNFDADTYTMDWDDVDDDNDPTTGTDVIRPLIYAQNNVNVAGDNIKDNTDVIVIVKASSEGRALVAGEDATAGIITLTSRDLDGVGNDDLNNTTKSYGLLVKENLSTAEFFHVDSASGAINPPGGLTQNYDVDDLIFRADVIIYRIDENATNPGLRRKNLGDNNGYQVVAENINNLQFRYLLNSGPPLIDNPSGSEPNVRAVEISIQAITANGQKTRTLTSLIKTRNIGL
jgi:prepilin-type N-terminal cleavage/methylation domain-containing protein